MEIVYVGPTDIANKFFAAREVTPEPFVLIKAEVDRPPINGRRFTFDVLPGFKLTLKEQVQALPRNSQGAMLIITCFRGRLSGAFGRVDLPGFVFPWREDSNYLKHDKDFDQDAGIYKP
jgi:hypothetical protein